jgi:hypothetical protein
VERVYLTMLSNQSHQTWTKTIFLKTTVEKCIV